MAVAYLAASAQLRDELIALRERLRELQQLRFQRRLLAHHTVQLHPQLLRSILRLLQLRLCEHAKVGSAVTHPCTPNSRV